MDEVLISRAICESYFKNFCAYLEVDVAIVGAGPSGLVAAYYLAKNKLKVLVLERHLKLGGGMPAGGMMFNQIVVEKEALPILDEFSISFKEYKENLYSADALEVISALSFFTLKKGAKIFNLISVEDVVVRENKICGLVFNWSAVEIAKLHVDPLSLKAKYVIDATGHDCEVCRIVERKLGLVLNTSQKKVIGEKPMWAQEGEKSLLKNTKEVYPGLFVCGMAANAVFGAYRMGAVFGGMFLSGKKVAEIICRKLNNL